MPLHFRMKFALGFPYQSSCKIKLEHYKEVVSESKNIL
jgi:hypothetical protein